jgi:hypothetical protein
MYEWHEEVKTPADEKIIWRYLSLEKYIDLLYRKQLFLCRLDKFNDPWEGEWTEAYKVRNIFARECLEGNEGLINNFFKTQYFISCWHLSEHESIAMWKIYSSEHAGIAIKTTIGRLKNSLTDVNQQLHIGEVEYIDDHFNYKEKEQNKYFHHFGGLSETCIKRKSFDYEKEVRLIECNQKKPESSYVDLNLQFIEEIRLSPLMEDAFVESIKALSEKFDIEPRCIEKSKLYNLVR